MPRDRQRQTDRFQANKEGEDIEGQQRGKKCLLPSLPVQSRTGSPPLPAQPERKRKGGPVSRPCPAPFTKPGADHRHLSSRSFSCPSASLLTSYVVSWLGSGSCLGLSIVLSSSVRVSSFPASASIRFSRAWCELLRPSCRSHRIMCIWAERGSEV